MSFDVVMGVMLLVFAGLGYRRGALRQVFYLAALVAALTLTAPLTALCVPIVRGWGPTWPDEALFAASRTLAVVGFYLVASVAITVGVRMVHASSRLLGMADRWMGALLGLTKGFGLAALISTGVTVAMDAWPSKDTRMHAFADGSFCVAIVREVRGTPDEDESDDAEAEPEAEG